MDTTNAAAVTPAAENLVIRYETQTCGRCGGGGRYSYCTMHGDRCFKCGGSGKQLTRAGAKASAAVEAFRLATYGRAACEVKIGDRAFLPFGWMQADRWQTVTGSNVSESAAIVDGVRIPLWDIKTAKGGLGTRADAVIKVWTAEGAAAVLAFARTQKGARVEPK